MDVEKGICLVLQLNTVNRDLKPYAAVLGMKETRDGEIPIRTAHLLSITLNETESYVMD